MRICYVLNSSEHGGMEHHVLDLVEQFCLHGHDVFVVCPNGSLVSNFKNLGATVFVKKINFDFDLGYILTLKSFLSTNNIQILHSHELKAGINCLLAGFLAKVPVKISHTHTPISEWSINKLKKFINYKIYSYFVNAFSSCEIAITPSRKRVKVLEGIKNNKIKVIPNGKKLNEFIVPSNKKHLYKKEMYEKYNIPSKNKVFGYLGRLSPEKNVISLIHAFNNFSLNVNNVTLFLAGGGVLQHSCEVLIKQLNLEDKVVITGKFKDEDLLKYYSTFDYFVFPSLAEGFGLVLTEAMLMEIPCICSNLEVLKEVGGDTIYKFFDATKVKSIETALKSISSENPKVLQNLAEKSCARVKNLYSIENFFINYENLYKEFL